MELINRITDVFGEIGDWIVAYMPRIEKLLYTPDNGLTFLGTMCIVTVGVSFFFLLLGIFQKFLSFKS